MSYHNEIVERLYDLVGDEYTILDTVNNSSTKVKIKHNKCGHQYDVLMSRFFQGNRCKRCASKRAAKTPEQFLKEVTDLVGDEYTFQESYVNAKTKLKVKHNTCGTHYEVTPNNFLRGQRCRNCYIKNDKTRLKYTQEQFEEWLIKTFKGEYSLVGDFKGVEVPVELIHTPCGNTVTPRPSNLKTSGKGCKHCGRKLASKNKMLTNEEFVRRVHEQVGDDYTFNEPYKRYNAKHSLTHNECGLIYQVTPNQFLDHERRCPNCQSSKGEQKIKKYLDDRGFKYKKEMTFDDLKYVNKLRFDYGVYKDGELLTLIEFDGLHHVKPVEKWGGEETLKLTQTRDAIKNQYAKDNNIPLLRIPYTKRKHISAILDDWFRQLA